MGIARSRSRLRRDSGFTLIETLVTLFILTMAVSFVALTVRHAMQAKVESRQLAVATNWVRSVTRAAGAADYADLGFFTGQAGAPTTSAPVAVPVNGTPISEVPVVLGTGPLVTGTTFTVPPVQSVAAKAPDPTDQTPLSDAGAAYKIETWVTQPAPSGGSTVSHGKRITVRVQWARTSAGLDGTCSGADRCTTESVLRPADAAAADPLTGDDAGTSDPCRTTAADVCDTYVRSGRVLGGAVRTAGGTLPAQIADVDLSARTTKAATSVTASWTFATSSGPLTITQALSADTTGTRWGATIPADPVQVGTTIKGKIRPGQVTVHFTAAFPSASASADTTASWSYTIPADQIGAHVTASLSSPAEGDTGWCSYTGRGTPVVVQVGGLSVGFTETDRITSADDRVDLLFTVTDADSTTHAVAVPATVVPGSVTPMTDATIIGDDGNPIAVAAQARWQAVAPASYDCTPSSTVGVRVSRAADQSTTTLPVHLTAPDVNHAPGTPTGLQLVSLTGTSAVVSWDSMPFATSYTLTVDGAAQTTTDNTATITGTPGATVNVQVTASNAAGTSAAAGPLAIDFGALPQVPTNLTVSAVTGTTATVSWTSAADATSYAATYLGESHPTTGTTAHITGGTPGSTITVQVAGVNASGTGPAASISITFQPLPDAPTSLHVVSTTTSTAAIAWVASPGATSYQVTWPDGSTGTTDTSATVTGSPGMTVTVQVAGVSPVGTGPAASVSVTFAQGTVTAVTLTRMYGLTAYLSWAAFDGATNYSVTASSGQSSTVTGTSTSLSLVSESTPTVTVTAKNGSTTIATGTLTVAVPWPVVGSSAKSSVQKLTPSATTPNTGNLAGTLDNRAGSAIVSTDGRYVLVLQHDGNLVEYDLSAGKAIADTGTNGKSVSYLIYQPGDGNIVLYGADGTVLGTTSTANTSPLTDRFQLQTDGNVVAYAGTSNLVTWALSRGASNSGDGADFMKKLP